jgi:hypothetical protein
MDGRCSHRQHDYVRGGDIAARELANEEADLRAVVLISLSLLTLPSHAAELIGTQVPPYPAGLDSLTGSCIGDTGKGEDICAYSIGTLNGASAVALAIFAGRSAGHATDGTPRWLVTGYLALPPLKEGYDVQIGTCRSGGVDDGSIIALARLDPDEEYSSDISWAARFERHDGALSQIATTGIDCINPGS